MGVAALIVAGMLAVVDWITVAERLPRSVRWLTKPGTMVALLVTALDAAPAGPAHGWIVAGLVLSLAGDVFLMLEERWFVAGLGSFLVAHVLYVIAMSRLDLDPVGATGALVLVVVAWFGAGRRIVAGAAARQPALRIPVLAYIGVISVMVVTADATRQPWLIAAAVAFYVSDALLGTNRFVGERSWMPVAVMVTYHVAQFSFVVFLLSQ